MGVTLADRLTVHPSVISRELAGETVLLNLESGVYYGLDSVGTRVWQLLQQDKTLADVCLVMVEEYNAPADVLQNDISTLVHELCEKQLLMPRQSPEA
jgi:hypothetical protein